MAVGREEAATGAQTQDIAQAIDDGYLALFRLKTPRKVQEPTQRSVSDNKPTAEEN